MDENFMLGEDDEIIGADHFDEEDSEITSAQTVDVSQYSLMDDTIDDKEFDIPPVQNLPTLESIMNAPDDDDLKPQHGIFAELNSFAQADQWEVASISSQESSTSLLTPTHKKTKSQKIPSSEKHGVIFRHVKLKSISLQFLSASDKVDAGMPTALTVSTFIAIGTSHGLVLIFDSKQVLRWCLGSTAVGAQYGAVSALSFNVDCTRLLCGFARGQITMWNLTNGKLLRTVLDAHPPGISILHVKFTDDRTVAVSSDSGGSVFQLEFKRLMGVRTCESQCLFSGSRGEACVIEPLCTQQAVPEHPMKDVAILAMATLSKVLVVVIKPHLKVHFVHVLPGDPSTLPLLSWQYVVIQVSESNRIIDPVLAFARDQTIYFAQVVCHAVDDIKVTLLQKLEVPYKLLSMIWINPRSIVILDTSERAHLVDVKTEEEIQVLDLADVQLVYSTSFYKSLATGGNVSRALAYAGDRACYQSIVSFNSQLVLLGTRGVHVLTLRSWSERINALVRQNKYPQALDLGLAFYKGEAKAVVGLSWNPSKRKAIVNELMRSVLLQFVDQSLTSKCPSRGKVEELKEHFQEVIASCLNYCISSESSSFLFGTLYDRLSKEQLAKESFLELLEPFILDDVLNFVTPDVMQSFIEHFKNKGELETVESCILHLDISSLDIHQVVSLCRSHGLHDTLFHIYNKGMCDYVTPLIELLDRLRASSSCTDLRQRSCKDEKLGNKILVYVSCCLSGHAYPFGEIPDERVNSVREQVLLCITSLHSPSALIDEPVYPYLRTLIYFNTREFFNALSLAFQGSQLRAKEKQRVVDILLLLMIENAGFTPSQIGILFVFLGRQMSRGDGGIVVKSVLFEQVLETLCTSDRSRHEEREQIMIDFLQTGVLEKFLNNQPREELKLVTMAESAGFYRVVEMLHVKQRRFDLALITYWKDASRGNKIFNFVKTVFANKSVTCREKESLKREVLENLDRIIKINAKRTAELMMEEFDTGLNNVLVRFRQDDKTLFQFLEGVFEHLEGLLKDGRIDYKKVSKIDATVFERYIELMCKFNTPEESIIDFLKKNSTYRSDVVIGISKQYVVKEVTCFLLEKSRDLSEAFSINLEILEENVAKNKCSLVELRISAILGFLQRNSRSMTTEQTHKFWFELLDRVLRKHKDLKEKDIESQQDDAEDSLTADWMRQTTSTIMTAGMPYLPSGLILQKIISSPAYSTGRFSELRGLMTNMMETCSYEQVLMMTCAKLVEDDLMSQMTSLKRTNSMALTSGPPDNTCALCCRDMFRLTSDSNSENNRIISFRCAHVYHLHCLSTFLPPEGNSQMECPACNKSKRRPALQAPPTTKHLRDDVISEDVHSLKVLSRSHKSPYYLSILSQLKTNSIPSRHHKRNIFQSEEFLNKRLAVPPINKL